MNGIIKIGTETQFVDTNKMVVVSTGLEPVYPTFAVLGVPFPPPDYLKKPHEQILRYAGGDILLFPNNRNIWRAHN